MAITQRRPPYRARITSQGQVTVPKDVRDRMGAKPGDELEFEETAGGFLVRHRPRIDVLGFAGAAAKSAREIPATAEDLDKAIARAAAQSAVAREARLRRARR